MKCPQNLRQSECGELYENIWKYRVAAKCIFLSLQNWIEGDVQVEGLFHSVAHRGPFPLLQTKTAAPDAESLPAALHSQSAWPYLACSNCSEFKILTDSGRANVPRNHQRGTNHQQRKDSNAVKNRWVNMTINTSHMQMSHDVCSWTSVKLQEYRDKLPPQVEKW